jgi:glucose/arabinose dehydrogenase
MPTRRAVLAGSAAGLLLAASGMRAAPGLRVEPVAEGLSHPWGVAFLDGGRYLVTERDGRLLLLDAAGGRRGIAGVPEVHARGQGGLLDVAIAPGTGGEATPRVWLSYAEPAEAGARTAVATGVLDPSAGRLRDVAVIFRQQPALRPSRHFGCRLVFAPDGMLFVTLGDRATQDLAQDVRSHVGKIVRIRPDGGIPADNPDFGPGAAAGLWSIGHRNIQGAAIRPADGTLWTIEHGAQGGDELNRPLPGRNYGWPVISYGRDYSGAKIGEGTARPGLEQPVHYWDPSIAPSGLAFLAGSPFAGWEGNAVAGALRAAKIVRIAFDGDRVASVSDLLEGYGRVRDVRQGPDGALWFLTDEDPGGLYRVTPG